jgi:NosR/NirI family nitrous oxide reductase transcriptional regulator
MKRLILILFLSCLLLNTVIASTIEEQYPVVQQFFPDANRFGVIEGTPPAAPVYKNDTLLGYIFATQSIASIPAYSGKPINILVGIDTKGIIKGTKVLEHHEPILLVGIPEQALQDFTAQYIDKKATDKIKVGSGSQAHYVYIDAVTGATVTVLVVNQTIMRAARKVARSRQLIASGKKQAAATVKVLKNHNESATWQELVDNNSIRRLHLSQSDIDRAFANDASNTPETAETQADDFIDLYYTYLNIPTIGRNLLGDDQYQWLMGELKDNEHAIAVMANGAYSFKGNGFVRGGIFDRVQLDQERSIFFRDADYHRLSDVYAKGMPDFHEMAIFIIRDAEFTPAMPWQLELLVRRQIGALESIFTSFHSRYQLPKHYLEQIAPTVTTTMTPTATSPSLEEELEQYDPIWISIWQEKGFQLSILIASLLILSLILIFQDWLVRYPRLLVTVRRSYAVYTVVFIGWYSLAQLSIVNVLTFVKAFMRDFRWETFLMDPLIFVMWGFVAVTLLLLGRGIYCGWLCPFGALQDLINQVARRFKVRQWEFPVLVHERLWTLKYIILLVLFAVSLQSLSQAERLAEVEPFKTVFILRFQRDWAFLFYALLLLVISIFNHKFYCKYLCPLGAALAVTAKVRLFDWLHRYHECGNPCQSCANRCEVRAIDKRGYINANECHYCLDCQVTYWDDKACPPLIAKRKRKEKHARRSKKAVQQHENNQNNKQESKSMNSGLETINVVGHPTNHLKN